MDHFDCGHAPVGFIPIWALFWEKLTNRSFPLETGLRRCFPVKRGFTKFRIFGAQNSISLRGWGYKSLINAHAGIFPSFYPNRAIIQRDFAIRRFRSRVGSCTVVQPLLLEWSPHFWRLECVFRLWWIWGKSKYGRWFHVVVGGNRTQNNGGK